jgi:hypothetical protein
MTEMNMLKKLDLTISTFTQLNQKGIYSILKSIGKLPLTHLKLNLSKYSPYNTVSTSHKKCSPISSSPNHSKKSRSISAATAR